MEDEELLRDDEIKDLVESYISQLKINGLHKKIKE
jgi:hypothetical protein